MALQYIDTEYSLDDAEKAVSKLKKGGKHKRVQKRKNVYPTHTPTGKRSKRGSAGTFYRIYAEPLKDSYAEGGKIKVSVGEKEEKGYPVYSRHSGYPTQTVSFHKSKELAEKKANSLRRKMADGGSIGAGAYILRLYEDSHDKVIHELGYDGMQDYLDDLNKRGIGYAEFEDGGGGMDGEGDAIYTHDTEVIDELQNEGLAFKTYSTYAEGGGIYSDKPFPNRPTDSSWIKDLNTRKKVDDVIRNLKTLNGGYGDGVTRQQMEFILTAVDNPTINLKTYAKGGSMASGGLFDSEGRKYSKKKGAFLTSEWFSGDLDFLNY